MSKLVIDITPELETRLRERAAERGLEVPEYARSLLESVVEPQGPPPISAEERAARVRAARGALAHLPGSVDEFLRRKHEEIELEEERWERRQKGADR